MRKHHFWGSGAPVWDLKSIKKSIKSGIKIEVHFWIDLWSIWGPFWEDFGSQHRPTIDQTTIEKTDLEKMSLGNWRVEPSGPLKWKMEDGRWEMEEENGRWMGAGWEVSGMWCAVGGGVWWVVGNGSGCMDPATPSVLRKHGGGYSYSYA